MSQKPLPVQSLGEEVQKIGEILVEGTDLAVALIATNFLDECLRSLLKASFRPGETTDSLLRSGRGVLGTYSARTDLSYSMGLIDKEAFKALRLVGQIRNVFAHSYAEGSFKDEEISPLCSRLDYTYELFVNQRQGDVPPDRIKAELDRFFEEPRNQFTYTCVTLGQTLIFAARHAEAEHHRASIDAAIADMASDEPYQKELNQIMDEFSAADWEAWKLGDAAS